MLRQGCRDVRVRQHLSGRLEERIVNIFPREAGGKRSRAWPGWAPDPDLQIREDMPGLGGAQSLRGGHMGNPRRPGQRV